MDSFSGENLTCVRGERMVFSRVSFSLTPGDALYLIGPNGSGKSSLLRMMAGFLRPTSGLMRWGDKNMHDDLSLHRARVSYIGHQDAVKGILTVKENLTFWANLAERGDAVNDALKCFSLNRLSDMPARFLSAGQRRRLNLARLVASPNPLWLLDEPTTTLDRESAEVLSSVTTEHQEAGGLVVQATHETPPASARTIDFRALESAVIA